MKNFTQTAAFFLVLLFSSLLSKATNYNNTGAKVDYSLSSGDTLRIASGNYTGKITKFASGSVIVVAPAATFAPTNITPPSGKLINYGSCTFTDLATFSGFDFENFGLFTVSGNLTLQDGSTQIWNNNTAAKIIVSKDFSMNNAVLTNYASMSVGGNFNLYTPTADFINKGLVNIVKDFSMSAGILDNQNRITTNKFNAYAGQVNNTGSIVPNSDITFSAGTSYVNQCLMITDNGFTNYGTFQNNGMLWVGRSGTSADLFLNTGTFINASDAQVKSVSFTNYGVISGGGSYYINGSSYNSGIIGKSGVTTDSIKVYDVTRTGSSIFDVQYGSVHSNVVYKKVALPDTNNVNYPGCSVFYKTDISSLLPVQWLYFNAKLDQKEVTLNWSAQFEEGMEFDVERSYDNNNFSAVSSLMSNKTKTYAYSEAFPETASVVYYRIKATSAIDGAVKYTDTKVLKLNNTNTTSLSVYPNPSKDAATVSYKSATTGQITLTVRNAAGQKMIAKNATVVIGANSISLKEVSMLNSGVYIIEISNANGVISATQLIKQ